MLESSISPMFMLVVHLDISPLINQGWGQIGSSVSSWGYMFYFASGITMIWGVALLWHQIHFKITQVKELLLDVKFWLLFWIATICMIANGLILTFLPIIIN
ncbi:hypothetical protein jhhlp_000520 [Lomentospora prolificans]|uniref:Uncharacterized protein n=1 Tax=Lomentospora prolificans TaxID=41688 RepID=A0A2N3NL40_9PEZI|nr:hypothetical protein jhhlp_000520 [Lomentospora prolificans]